MGAVYMPGSEVGDLEEEMMERGRALARDEVGAPAHGHDLYDQ
jgi:hypothetical protein